MIIDFTKLDCSEPPVLVLENANNQYIGVAHSAYGTALDVKYNEVSTLSFNVPAYLDGELNPAYDKLAGLRVINMNNIAKFILTEPIEKSDGVRTYKECNAYSLEYELSYKKIVLSKSTYNFWNPAAPEGTILHEICSLAPGWTIGYVDSALMGQYRTLEANDNIYNFIKQTAQKSYGCIFNFDTMNRVMSVISVDTIQAALPIYLSTENLLKEISISESVEDIVTSLDVYGNDGIDIRSVNPTGTNTIINLDYYMTEDNFSAEIINKYNLWKDNFNAQQEPYYNLSVRHSLFLMNRLSLQAQRTDEENTLVEYENLLAVTLQGIAQGNDLSERLVELNSDIERQKGVIATLNSSISVLEQACEDILQQMASINRISQLSNYFAPAELIQLQSYIKEDSLTETSFAAPTHSAYKDGESVYVSDSISCVFNNGNIVKSNDNSRDIYAIKGGNVDINFSSKETEYHITADIINATFDAEGASGTVSLCVHNGGDFSKGLITINGTINSISSDCQAGELQILEGTSLHSVIDGVLYITMEVTDYEKKTVAWDLFQYASKTLQKLSSPTHTLNLTSANFLAIEDFKAFKNQLTLGRAVYIETPMENILSPIFTGCNISWDSPESLQFYFSDKYLSSEGSFLLADLLEQSVSLGKSLDTSKYLYSAFNDTGTESKVNMLLNGALDIARRSIMSSNNQAIAWDDAGIRIRKYSSDSKDSFDPHQLWINNNSILITRDNWSSAEVAIGYFGDDNAGQCWGISGKVLVGTVIAGKNLVIESEKQDGGIAVFRMDADGCKLYNSVFDIVANNTQISLNPEHGIVMGSYPVYKNEDGKETINTDNATFWVGNDGNLHIKGILEAASGVFTGAVQASSFIINDGTTVDISLSEKDEEGNIGKEFFSLKNDFLTMGGFVVDSLGLRAYDFDSDGLLAYGFHLRSLQDSQSDTLMSLSNYGEFVFTLDKTGALSPRLLYFYDWDAQKSTANLTSTGITSYSDGTQSATWLQIVTGATPSDKNLKENISDLDDKIDILFSHLKPTSFSYNKDDTHKLHYGFIAQDVIEALQSAGINENDCGIILKEYNKESEREEYSLKYGEFVSINTFMIQKLLKRIECLEQQVKDLLK